MTQVHEFDLHCKKAELIRIQARIAYRESELESELVAIIDFQSRYTSCVGSLQQTLDHIHTEIATLLAVGTTEPPISPPAATFQSSLPNYLSTCKGLIKFASSSLPKKQADSSMVLVSLFRQAAIKLHPDFSTDDRERERRCRAMAQLNNAYEMGDLEAIQRILSDWETDVASELNGVDRHLDLAKKRLLRLDREMAEIKSNRWYSLYCKETQYKKKGKDLLAILSNDLKSEIVKAKRILESLKKRKS